MLRFAARPLAAAGAAACLSTPVGSPSRCSEDSTTASRAPGSIGSSTGAAWNSNWDLRENTKVQPKVVHTVILVRHGQYVTSNKSTGDELLDDSKRVLTPKGREQSALTGMRLQELISSSLLPPIDAVYYSTMARATETAEILTKQLLNSAEPHKHLPCSLLREGAVFPPSPPSSSWQPSEESFVKDSLRAEAAFLTYLHRADEHHSKSHTTLLICHGNVIRYLLLRTLQLDPSAWLRLAVNNASITRIDVYENGNVSVKAVGECGHLPAALVTYQ